MFHNSCYVVLDLDVVPNPLFHNSFNFFVNFFDFVFWRFIELQASYRAQIKTVDRSRRPGKNLKYMLGACAPKKFRKTSAKVRSRGRWHARSVENPPHRCRCPGVLKQCAFIYCRKYLILVSRILEGFGDMS